MKKALSLFAILAIFATVPIFAQTFRCESDGRYHECTLDNTTSRVIMTRQLSNANCVEGQTWGVRNGRLWVSGGCRADFAFAAAAQPLDSLVVCESKDGKMQHCTADTTAGVRLARQISDSGCVYGRDWGYDNNGVWVNNGCRAEFGVRSAIATMPGTPGAAMVGQTIRCESDNNTRSHCAADTRYGVAMARQLSDNDCVRDRSWGIDASGIWVDKGCRADFSVQAAPMISASQAPTTVIYTQQPPPTQVIYTQQPPPTQVIIAQPMTTAPATVVCESQNNGRTHCNANTSMGITLVRQLSQNECVRDSTWGVDQTGVWVNNGCRAEFAMGSAQPTTIVPVAPPPAATFMCESLDGSRQHCAVDTMLGVNLLRQVSDADCILNQTWGVDATGVWVSKGCRAQFSLGNLRTDLGNVSTSSRLLCESKDGKRTVCPADTRMGVAVVRQISDTNCVYNSTWGFDANGIWVTAGCRAEFTLRR